VTTEQLHPKLEELRKDFPEKFLPTQEIFKRVHRGNRIFIGTACAEPQFLVQSLVDYAESYPKAFFDAEVIQVWTLGVAPYTNQKFKSNFRHNSFFVGDNTRKAVNEGFADYTPIFLSQVPGLLHRHLVEIDVALIQTSLPDEHGYLSLGISVDIVKAAVENAKLVIAQVNESMPRVHGDGFLHVNEIDFLVPHNEPLLEFNVDVPDEIAQSIGKHVARIVQDGDTIQVGYGSIPNAVIANLKEKHHLGVHSELLTDGIVDLIRCGAVDCSKKNLDRGKVVTAFCMGKRSTYEFLHDNPSIEFRSIEYTNDPLTIARMRNMTAINAALQIDLTGQATAESIGPVFYSGIGGQADFMRGAVLAPGGKTILTIRSTSNDGQFSRIVPFLSEGAGVTLGRGDIHYVVTEFGIAYLHGKNIRERAINLISIAHPRFRPWLIEEAKRVGLIYRDQAFIPGKKGEYPEIFETYRTTRTGVKILLRPVKMSDEPILKDFFYSLSDRSTYRRFISTRQDMTHERLQNFVIIDYTREMVILAVVEHLQKEIVVGVAQYGKQEQSHAAEVAIVVSDDYQNKGIGTELLSYVTFLARKEGLLGFTAEVLMENRPMLHLFEKMGFIIERHSSAGVYELRLQFRGDAS
jgi:acyl-CoA hydrolase/RimJ/RimL family protein N-acetyltransferase